jgi:hypothetical protein
VERSKKTRKRLVMSGKILVTSFLSDTRAKFCWNGEFESHPADGDDGKECSFSVTARTFSFRSSIFHNGERIFPKRWFLVEARKFFAK